MKKSNLDEMQEQNLLKIEHTAFWLAYWCLLASILVQIILGMNPAAVLGECSILLIVCAYMVYGCLKHGIWDRRFKPTGKTNLLFSLAASLFVGVFTYFLVADLAERPLYLGISCLIPMVFTFLLTFGCLTLSARIYKKRREKLDEE